VIQTGRTIPSGIDIRFHIAVMNEQPAIGMRDEVISIAQTSSNFFDDRTVDRGTDHRTARRLDAACLSARILITWHQVAFVRIDQRLTGADLADDLCMVTDDDVDHAIGTERDAVRTMFTRLPFEADNLFNRFERTVAICVAQTVQPHALRPDAGDEYLAVERQDTLA